MNTLILMFLVVWIENPQSGVAEWAVVGASCLLFLLVLWLTGQSILSLQHVHGR